MHLVADDGQRAGEALVAQRLRGAQPGQRRTDDHDPALGLECPDEVVDQRVRAHFVVLSDGRVHLRDDRLHRAGRHRPRHLLTLRVIGIRVVGEGFLALQLKHLRRQRDALRVSQAPVQIHDDAHAFRLLLNRR